MPQNKIQIKLTIILLLTTILISQFFLISLAKTEIYFSFYDDPETVIIKKINKVGQDLPCLFSTTMKGEPEKKIINIGTAYLEEFLQVLQISKPLIQKIIILREELEGFKEPIDFTQLSGITNLEWKEWKEEGIEITVKMRKLSDGSIIFSAKVSV